MILVGDIASPNAKCTTDLKNIFHQHAGIFSDKTLVCNFEGLVCDTIQPDTSTPVLYNHSSVLDVLSAANTKVVCLANNHILDLPFCFDDTVIGLTNNKIEFAGAGKSKQEAIQPVVFFDGNTKIILFNFCWDFLLYNQKNPSEGIHIATINFHNLTEKVRMCKEQNPGACVIIYLHWSLDLEILPFPMYREFAKNLIDAGAAVVVGCHSHCVQGGEKYKEGYIVYGQGNFFLPTYVFANGKLFYPPFSETQLVLEYVPATNEAFCHWFKYENQQGAHSLNHLETSTFLSSSLLKKHSPYQGMNQKEYIYYFKKNRRKKIMIPLFKTYHNKQKLYTLTSLLKARATFARMMARVNLIKWGS